MRLIVTYISIIVITLLFISTYVLVSMSQYLKNQQKVETLANANVIANVISEYMDNPMVISFLVNQTSMDTSSRIIITDETAKVIYDSAGTNSIFGKVLIKQEIMSALKGNDTVNAYKEKDIGTVIQGAATVISESETVGVVYISEVASSIDEFIANVRWILVVISLIACLLIGVLSSVMSDIIIGPIERFTKIIRGMEGDTPDKHVPVMGKDEVAEMGIAFNSLIDKLDQMEEKRRLFVSNASHELKTPLSSIKLLSDSVISMNELDDESVREFMTDINGEVDRLTKIIDRLLSLTKLDVGDEGLDLKVTDLNEMAGRIVKSLQPVSEAKNVMLTNATNREALAMVDREKFWQVVYNITDNAVKYTPSGGTVTVYVFNEGEYCRIEIVDTGRGIPEADVNKIFDRFYRVDKARARESGGTGLGLSIANDVVTMHEGKIIVDSKEGVGTKFIIIVPKKLQLEG